MNNIYGITYESTLTCPGCGHQEVCHMPVNECVWIWECPACGILLRPQAGDCCVFCSYGSTPCPPRQQQQAADSHRGQGQ